MIDIRKLKELVRLMVENDLSEIDLRDQEEKVTIKRGSEDVPVVHQAPAPAAVAAAAPPPTEHAIVEPVDADNGLLAIESPMVGTFYSAANPDSDPFAAVGTSVSATTTVCMVEAMKVFNEIKAECSGTIERVLVENGQAVEFGQPLFMVKPA